MVGDVNWHRNRLLLMAVTDTLESSLHRVTLPPFADRIQNDELMRKERYSIVYFVGADADAVVECLPACVDGEHPAKYEPITQRAYCQMRSKVQYRRADPLVTSQVGGLALVTSFLLVEYKSRRSVRGKDVAW
jgi:hypothetical protein